MNMCLMFFSQGIQELQKRCSSSNQKKLSNNLAPTGFCDSDPRNGDSLIHQLQYHEMGGDSVAILGDLMDDNSWKSRDFFSNKAYPTNVNYKN